MSLSEYQAERLSYIADRCGNLTMDMKLLLQRLEHVGLVSVVFILDGDILGRASVGAIPRVGETITVGENEEARYKVTNVDYWFAPDYTHWETRIKVKEVKA